MRRPGKPASLRTLRQTFPTSRSLTRMNAFVSMCGRISQTLESFSTSPWLKSPLGKPRARRTRRRRRKHPSKKNTHNSLGTRVLIPQNDTTKYIVKKIVHPECTDIPYSVKMRRHDASTRTSIDRASGHMLNVNWNQERELMCLKSGLERHGSKS